MTKAEIIRRGTELGVDYRLTHSCYDPDPRGRPCGRCDACQLRLQGLRRGGPGRSAASTHRENRRNLPLACKAKACSRAPRACSCAPAAAICAAGSATRRTRRGRPRARTCRSTRSWPRVGECDAPHVVVTGGEPMLFAELIPLADALRAARAGTSRSKRPARSTCRWRAT